jgi:transposase
VDVIHRRCAGLDMHQDEVVGCARGIWTKGPALGRAHGFRPRRAGSRALRVAEQQQCEMVALEATGVYWKPVWHMLEAHFTLVLANPGHVRAIPAPTTSTGMTQPEPPLGSRRV